MPSGGVEYINKTQTSRDENIHVWGWMNGGLDIAEEGLVNWKAAIGTIQNYLIETRQREKRLGGNGQSLSDRDTI